jgi:hypothetical protein
VPARISLRSQLLAGTAFLFALRLILSLIRTGPVLVADEIGYLTNARVISGGLAGQLELAPFYRGGYSLLIAPLIDLSSDPTVVYHLVLVLNAALAASIFPLLYLLLSRYASVPPRIAIWAALAAGLYPAVTVLSQVAMSENALFPLVCVWLIAFAGLLNARDRGPSLLWAAGLGASTGALFGVHNRMIATIAITVAGLLWLGARRRIAPGPVALAIVVLAATALGAHILDQYLIDHNYGGVASEELSTRASDLFSAQGLRTAAANLVGQAWYLIVATFGLAAAVVADFVLRIRRRRLRAAGPDLESPAIPLVGILLAFTGVLLLVSATAFPERTRPDMLIYGRYTEVVAPPLIAVSIAVLSRARFPRSVAGPLIGFVLLTGVVALIRATASDPDPANRWNISALPFITMQLGPAILVGAAVVAAAGALLLRYGAQRSPQALGAIAIALFLAVAAYGAWNPVRSSQRAVYPSGWRSPQSVAAREPIRQVAYDLGHYDAIGLFVTQWFLPRTSVSLLHGSRVQPRSGYVLSSLRWPREHRESRATRLWVDEGRDQALWKLRPHAGR